MVVFLDSGIGGLPYCDRFLALAPSCPVVYFADRAAFPYGSKTRKELAALLITRATLLLEHFPAVRVMTLACNTASVSALDELRAAFPVPAFVGTVPAVKPALLAGGAAGVLGTERTIADPYLDALASRYGQGPLVKRAAPELVTFVERELESAGTQERLLRAASYVQWFREQGVSGIVLGCTHFLFLLKEFRKAAAPDISVYDSVDGVARRVLSLVRAGQPHRKEPDGADADTATDAAAETPRRILLLSGKEPPEQAWINRARERSMEIRLAGEQL
jgi:glutamate racemase